MATVGGVVLVVTGANARSAAIVGIGVGLAFIGLLLLGPVLARPFSRGIGAPVGRVRGVTGDLAKENAGRNPKRTAATAQALMIGVLIVSFFLVVNASLRASIDAFLDDSFTGDFVIDSGSFGVIGLPTEVGDRVSEVPGVADVVPVRFARAQVEGDDTDVVGTTPGAFDLLGLRLQDGSSSLAPGTIVLTADKARDLGLGVGDEVSAEFINTGSHTYTVGGIYDTEQEGTDIGSFVLGLDDYDAAVGGGATDNADVTDSSVFVKLEPGVSVAEVEPEIEAAVADFPTAEVQSVDEYKDAIGSQFDAILLADARPPGAGPVHRLDRHRQHHCAVGDRAHPRAGTAAGGRAHPGHSCGPPFVGNPRSSPCSAPCSGWPWACSAAGGSSRR